MLATDADGSLQLNEGVAPMVAPQFRTSGFGYEHVPPEIEVIENFERFDAGAGFDRADGDNTRYHFSRGVDLSWEDIAIVELEKRTLLESDGTAIAAQPSGFFLSSLGLHMRAGAYIYEWDLTTTSWIVRRDSSATFSGAVYTDMKELDGVLVAARGASADYDTSTDGVTFTAFTAEDENIDVMTNRGNSSDVAALWKVKTNVIKVSTDPTIAGWTGSDEIGHTGETIRSALTVDNDLYLFKKEGIYFYDGTNVQDLWKSQYLDDNNGKGAFLWGDKAMYVPYGRRLFRYDPNSNAAANLLPVFPTAEMDCHEIRGDITAVGGSETHLFIAVKTLAGNTYILKGRPKAAGWAWHTVHYLGANDCNALAFIGPGTMHATNPCLVFGYGATGSKYVVYPRQNNHPYEDSAVTFETAEGVVYGPYVSNGTKTFPKFLNRGAVLGHGLSAGRYATLKYETDRSGTETTLVSAVGDSLTEADETSEVSYHQMRYALYMATGDEGVTPQVDAWVFGSTLNPPRKLTWSPVVILSKEALFREGAETESQPAPDVLKRILFAALTKRVTLTDRTGFNGLDFRVRLLDIEQVALQPRDYGDYGSDALGYRLSLVAINSLSSDALTAIYGQSAYGSGHVYS